MVVVGGGSTGLAAAFALARGPLHVTVLDRRATHVPREQLPEIAAGRRAPAASAVRIQHALRRCANTVFAQAGVVSIDPAKRWLAFRSGGGLRYDYLVLACGDELEDTRVEDGCSIDDEDGASALAESLRADAAAPVVIIGRGAHALSLAGALVTQQHTTRQVVVEQPTQPTVADAPQALLRMARRSLEGRGVIFHDGAPTEPVRPVGCRIVVTQPRRTPDLVATLTETTEPSERLARPDHANVFVPGLSWPRHRAGRHAARCILAELEGAAPPAPFRPFAGATSLSLGPGAAVAQVGRLASAGLAGRALHAMLRAAARAD